MTLHRTILPLLLLAFATRVEGQPLGSIFITRNLDERENTSPGYWNHLAIVVRGGFVDGFVVESQEGHGVIATRMEDFFARPYRVKMLYPRDRVVGERAAAIARSYVGRPYRRGSSLAPLLVPPIIPTLRYGTADGMNCTSVIRGAYEGAIGRPLIGLRFPDDICNRPDIISNRPQ